MNKIKTLFKCFNSYISLKTYLFKTRNVKLEQNDNIVIFNTEVGSDNLGDGIIMSHCREVLAELLPGKHFLEVASHIKASAEEINEMLRAKAVIVCGTNFLAPRMELNSVWRYSLEMVKIPNILLIACGGGYGTLTPYTKLFYRELLNNNFMHSVRDSQTRDMLHNIEVDNVINTNCVTLWGLDKKCDRIPKRKSNKAVVTITGYMHDVEMDRFLFDTVNELYDKVYFWPQGQTDLQYVNENIDIGKTEILERSLQAYDECLSAEIDYIGSRLHGGIHAMQNLHRAIIIAVDNRAIEIAKDTNIPVLLSTEVKNSLRPKILGEWETKIHLNNDEIARWKESVCSMLQ